jgi:hypothetical protein
MRLPKRRHAKVLAKRGHGVVVGVVDYGNGVIVW